MLITVRPIEVDDQPTVATVAAILESWSIDEIRQLVEEMEVEIRSIVTQVALEEI